MEQDIIILNQTFSPLNQFDQPHTFFAQNETKLEKKNTFTLKEQDTIFLKNQKQNENNLFNKNIVAQPKKITNILQALHLLFNVMKFVKILIKDARIYQLLTEQQHQLIQDKAAFFTAKNKNKGLFDKFNQIWINIGLFISEKIQRVPTISPNNIVKKTWDAFFVLNIITCVYNFSLVFFFGMNINQTKITFQFNYVVSLIDIFLIFNTGISEKGKFIMLRQKIALKYLKNKFILDLISNIPLFVFFYDVPLNKVIIRTLTVLNFLKLFTLSDVMDRLAFYFSFEKNMKNIVDLFKLTFIIICVGHFFACFWHALAIYEIDFLEREDTWLHAKNLIDQNVNVKYVYSIYFLAATMITVGYGDITPQNYIECTFVVTTMFVTGMVYAYSLNSIGNIISEINKLNQNYKDDMQAIHSFMRKENVKSDLRTRVSNYLEYLYKESNSLQKSKEEEVINKLSTQLKSNLVYEVQEKYLKDIPFIAQLESYSQIVQIMEEINFSPGEIIFEPKVFDENCLYYLVKGRVQIVFESLASNREDTVIKYIKKKQYFGEISFLTGNLRESTAKATEFCRLYKVKRESFNKIICQYQQDYEKVTMYKEGITLKNKFRPLKIACNTCNWEDHSSIDCPKTHFTIDQSVYIKKLNISLPHKTRNQKKRRKWKFRCLMKQEQCYEAIININENATFENYLNQIELNLNINYEELEQMQKIMEEEQSRIQEDSQENIESPLVTKTLIESKPSSKKNQMKGYKSPTKNVIFEIKQDRTDSKQTFCGETTEENSKERVQYPQCNLQQVQQVDIESEYTGSIISQRNIAESVQNFGFDKQNAQMHNSIDGSVLSCHSFKLMNNETLQKVNNEILQNSIQKISQSLGQIKSQFSIQKIESGSKIQSKELIEKPETEQFNEQNLKQLPLQHNLNACSLSKSSSSSSSQSSMSNNEIKVKQLNRKQKLSDTSCIKFQRRSLVQSVSGSNNNGENSSKANGVSLLNKNKTNFIRKGNKNHSVIIIDDKNKQLQNESNEEKNQSKSSIQDVTSAIRLSFTFNQNVDRNPQSFSDLQTKVVQYNIPISQISNFDVFRIYKHYYPHNNLDLILERFKQRQENNGQDSYLKKKKVRKRQNVFAQINLSQLQNNMRKRTTKK